MIEHSDGTTHLWTPNPQSTHTTGGPPKYYDYGKLRPRGRIVGSPSPLERRLREKRYEGAAQACALVLDGIRVPVEDRCFLPLSDVEELWPRYVSLLRGGGEARTRWSSDERADVQRHIDTIRDAVDGLMVVWLVLVNSEPVGVEVPADALLGTVLTYLVSPAGDLMLGTRDLASGICIELNHLASGDEYEIVAWGVFCP